jgi:hypothetical protein
VTKPAPATARVFLSTASPAVAHNPVLGQFDKRKRLVEMFGPPGKQTLGIFQPDGEIVRLARHIPDFIRVGREIVEERWQAAAEMDVFEAFGPYHGEVAALRPDPETPFGVTR